MKTTSLLIFAFLFLLIGLYISLQRQLREKQLEKINRALAEQDFLSFDRYTGSLLSRLTFTPYDRSCIRLNGAFLRKDKDYTDQVIKEFELLDLNQLQKQDIYLRIFNYYMSEKDYGKAERYKERICREIKDKELVRQTEVIYDIYALQSSGHLEELLNSLEELPMNQRGYTEMLISDSYKNLEDHRNAKKYKELSLAHFKQLEKDIKQQKSTE